MQTEEFDKIWNLYQTLFPAASSRLKNANTRKAWQVALEPYAMDDVVDASMRWARKTKFFPDIADITGNLIPEQLAEDAEDPALDREDRRMCPKWMIPYVQRTFGRIAEGCREQLHAAGLETWREASERGVPWLEWLAACRTVFGEDILPLEPDSRVCGEA